MRKFTLFLASLLVAIGAMAQTTTIDVAKTYTLECQSGAAHNTTRFIGVTDGVINGQSATGAEITFEAVEEGSYYIKVGDKYINHNGTAISASAEASTAWVLGTVNNLVTFKVPETTLYLNNNGSDCADGTVTNLKANDHSTNANQAPTANNACSTWAMVEYVAPEEGGEEEVNEFENKMIASIGAAATSIEAEQWYVLYNQARGCYVSEETTSFMMRNTGNLTLANDATEKAGYLFQFEATGNENEYYIMSGNGLYFSINQGGSTVSTTPVAYTIAQIGDNAGHFYGQMVSDGRVLDGNANGGALAGWDTTVPSGTGGNNDYQFLPVTFIEKELIPDALTEFNPNKCYTATVKVRGGWAVNNEGQFVSYKQAGEVADANKQFAVLSADNENYYLFSVGANAFVKKDGTTVQGIADPIVLHDASAEGECRVLVQFKGYNDGYINLNQESNMDICTWSSVDYGNAIAFIEAGEFNPTEALAMLSSAVTVTYTFVHEGETIATQTATVNKGKAYPAINATLPYGVTATVPEGLVEGPTEKTIEVEVSKELPFVAASDAASITNWYYVRMHTNEPGFIGNIAEDNTINVGSFYVATSADTKENHLWGFVGNVFDGIKVVNKGTGKMLTSTGDGNVTLTDEGTALFIDETEAPGMMNATDGFCLRNPEAADFINANYGTGKLSHWSARDNGSTFMVIEPTESLDVTITEAGYATYYWNLPAYIPEGVQAFVVNELNGTYAIMNEITGTIPANTGVILKGSADAYSFAVAHYVTEETATAVRGNKLRGSVASTDIPAAENTTYYVLANGTEGVGLYKDELDGGTFRNNANKAYLPVVAEAGANAAASYSFNFDWAGTTGIEGVTAEGAQDGAIYDITGRRVKAITAPGIYIVNGKKVVK